MRISNSLKTLRIRPTGINKVNKDIKGQQGSRLGVKIGIGDTKKVRKGQETNAPNPSVYYSAINVHSITITIAIAIEKSPEYRFSHRK